MKCLACAGLVPVDAVFCPGCGTDVRSAAPSASGAREHKVALAAANLLRLRGKWSEAEARCIEVLRADPNDVHAHSLLGDIYADQGRLEDATQWYQLALDIDPKSRADREKLSRLRREETSLATKDGITAGTHVLGVETGLAVRWIGLILAVFLLGAGGAWLSQRGRGAEAPVVSGAGTPGSVGKAPSVRSAGAAAGRATVAAPPAAEDMAGEAADTEAESAGIIEREITLEQRVRAAAPITERSVIAAVVLAGDGRTAAVVLGRHPVAAEAAPDRGEIVLDALRACQSAAHADPQVGFVDVTVRAPSGEPLFRGRAARTGLLSQSASTTPDQAASAFTAVWWPPDAA